MDRNQGRPLGHGRETNDGLHGLFEALKTAMNPRPSIAREWSLTEAPPPISLWILFKARFFGRNASFVMRVDEDWYREFPQMTLDQGQDIFPLQATDSCRESW